ncbi:MAG: phosphoenolpyruvate carboxykinase (GTP), partial [bacterium]|nr:phosphoenolpyruvate carboxykinase (GTP) [bacterium]
MTQTVETTLTKNKTLLAWVKDIVQLCQPDQVVWCDGSEEEKTRITRECVERGEVEALNPEKLPGCLYARSDIKDVARVEHLTFICAKTKEEVGPTNNWMDPQEAYKKASAIVRGSMKGRAMYVIPYIMGIPGSPFSKIGIELSDSAYVVLNMRIMTRTGRVALDELGDSPDFTKGLHAKVDLDPEKRLILHFPQDNTIWSTSSNYGGNVLQGKKCLALRIASNLGRKEGWLAEHMLIVGIENPKGEVSYVAAAFPSQCGKTNLAMLVPPASLKGYKLWTVGDDIAWLRVGPDGRLWALNPEAGFFGVAPGTSSKSNPNALKTTQKNTIFTNVLKTPDGNVWWEGLDGDPPKEGINWKGELWTPASQDKGAHPNSRFTAPASQCPSIAPNWEDPKGVPLSAIIFGGRRAKVTPLVLQSFDWQ